MSQYRGTLLHVLKIETDYFREVRMGIKKAEFRINDRDYRVGDLIHFVNINGYEFNDFKVDKELLNARYGMFGELFNPFINCYRITHITECSKYIRHARDNWVMLSIEKVS